MTSDRPTGNNTPGSETSGSDTSDQPVSEPLSTPRDGMPPLLTTADEVADYARRLAGGSGPVAIDTERASGYRYSDRAYLVQLRRAGAGSALIDPITAGPMDALAEALNPLEWVLHSADQDLPCLAELGLRPAVLFDTELAGRLLALPKVNLAAMVEREFSLVLAKGHGAADWSQRPLPDAWLNYAALDVELLVELRNGLAGQLADEGKTEWARQEFEHIRTALPPPPRPDRWRRTSGIHKIRDRRALAAVRALWSARDDLAQSLDRAPGRVLPDSAIVDAATTDPATVEDLRALKVFGGPRQRRRSRVWLGALADARDLPECALPPTKPSSGLPAPGRWASTNPEAAERLSAARNALAEIAEEHHIPAENLVAPRVLKQLCWDGLEQDTANGVTGDDGSEGAGGDANAATAFRVDELLRDAGARPWQRELVVPAISAALDSIPAE